jgi:hypothetical protein
MPPWYARYPLTIAAELSIAEPNSSGNGSSKEIPKIVSNPVGLEPHLDILIVTPSTFVRPTTRHIRHQRV